MALQAVAVADLRRQLRQLPGVREALILQTCNRIELYAAADASAQAGALRACLSQATGIDAADFDQYCSLASGEDVVRHLFKVAAGLDSQIVGETEILGQVKAAYAAAQDAGTLGPTLHRLLQKALQAAKWARTHTAISQGQVSLGNVAVELAQRIFGRLTVSRTLVIGSGEVGRDVARAFRSRGVACISIAGRNAERTAALAKLVDGLVIPFAAWQERLPYVDIAIFATSAPGCIIDAAELTAACRQRPRRPLFLIDLAVPRNVDPAAADLSDVFLYNFDDLAGIANENLRNREAEVAACIREIDARAQRFWARHGGEHAADG